MRRITVELEKIEGHPTIVVGWNVIQISQWHSVRGNEGDPARTQVGRLFFERYDFNWTFELTVDPPTPKEYAKIYEAVIETLARHRAETSQTATERVSDDSLDKWTGIDPIDLLSPQKQRELRHGLFHEEYEARQRTNDE